MKDLFRYSLATTGNPEAARDAVQEGFARALRARATFLGTGSLEAWVARCVLNAARDHMRGEPRLAPEAAEERSAADGREPAFPNDELRAVLRGLPLRQREALFLRFYLDLDYAGIAEVLGIGTVSATLNAARASITQAIQEVARQ